MCFIPFTTRDKKVFGIVAFFCSFLFYFFVHFLFFLAVKQVFQSEQSHKKPKLCLVILAKKINQHEFYKTDNYSQIKRNVLRPN